MVAGRFLAQNLPKKPLKQACIDDPDTIGDPSELRAESTTTAVLAFLFLPGAVLVFTLFLTRKTRIYRALGADFELVRSAKLDLDLGANSTICGGCSLR